MINGTEKDKEHGSFMRDELPPYESLSHTDPEILKQLKDYGTPGEITFNEESLRDAIQSILDAEDSKFEQIGYVGGGTYYLGNGIYTGELGWKNFNEALYKRVHEFGKDENNSMDR